jgi:hypothetical protein
VKVQCRECKEIVPLAFSIVPGGIEVTCPSCHQLYRVDATTEKEPALPRRSGDMVCPKCGETQPPAEACRRCGLIQDRWRGPESAADGTELDLANAREAGALWEACVVEWDDPGRHDAFLRYCQQGGIFALAAARYRSVLQTSGEHDPVAAGRLKQVRAMAEQALVRAPRPAKESKAETPYKYTVVLLGAGVALLAGGIVVYLMIR